MLTRPTPAPRVSREYLRRPPTTISANTSSASAPYTPRRRDDCGAWAASLAAGRGTGTCTETVVCPTTANDGGESALAMDGTTVAGGTNVLETTSTAATKR